MKPSTIAARLMDRLRAGPTRARDLQDFADYGTAFALDLSIEARPAADGGSATDQDPQAWWSQLASHRPAPGL